MSVYLLVKILKLTESKQRDGPTRPCDYPHLISTEP